LSNSKEPWWTENWKLWTVSRKQIAQLSSVIRY